ncbi:hypothetical protein [Paenibacillus paeoniae]|uniref:Uncharacterized protein n=1 Tax=Paenibacillus paeoniae TaxID=2292705 RepID=A0A371PM06_9BACL|nr:hypothetical protein [Paenibacillus paeoniae]REK77025.1 hypothetical protein DX130_08445 [Paenibacillus paeoniae]
MAYYFFSLIMPYLIVAIPIMLLLLLIWKKTERQDERNLGWKTAGYLLLTPFRLLFNGLYLPAGALVAWLFYRNAKQNKVYKGRVILLGLVVYLIGFLPLQSGMQDWFYPRDQMSTYLTIGSNEQKRGFNFLMNNPEGTIYWSYHMQDEKGRQIYEAMKQSTPAKERPYMQHDDEWRLLLQQDSEKYRESFQDLEFYIRPDSEVFWLVVQNQRYSFQASPELLQLLQPLMKVQSNP